MAADGNATSAVVNNFTYEKKHAKVIDSILNSAVLMSRFMGMAEEFQGKFYEVELDVALSNQGQWFSQLDTLNTADVDTVIPTQYAHVSYQIPFVVSLDDAMANSGPQQVINLPVFKMEKVGQEGYRDVAAALYGTGSTKRPLGLEAIVDDGTNKSTLGGQTRATYPTALNAGNITNASGVVTLNKLSTAIDGASAAGYDTEEPNIGVTTKSTWALIEQLMQPFLQAQYTTTGYQMLYLRSSVPTPADNSMGGMAGFRCLLYRGIPILKDDACTANTIYFLNEKYLKVFGRTTVPEEFKKYGLRYVNLGVPKTIEGPATAPSKYHGWFVQEYRPAETNLGIYGRYIWFGQLVPLQPRRNSKITNASGI